MLSECSGASDSIADGDDQPDNKEARQYLRHCNLSLNLHMPRSDRF